MSPAGIATDQPLRTAAPLTSNARSRQPALIRAALVLLIFVTAWSYRSVVRFDYVNYDDPKYVLENRMVTEGLSRESFMWAWTTGYFSNWHPLTWLSHQLDTELFGLRPGPRHLVNLMLHLINTVLVYSFLERLTAAGWRSLLVAALFALHPLHVESVAWISERKDVLSTLFGLLAMIAYVREVRARAKPRLWATAGWLALSLCAKPMLVTLPCLLLLLDFWPLDRSLTAANRGLTWRQLVLEKTGLFLLAGLSSLGTIAVQRGGGAVKSLDVIPLGARLGNAAMAYVTYLAQTVWPAGLCFNYPHPFPQTQADGMLGVWATKCVLALAVLLAITWFACRNRHRAPYLLVGWEWYLVSLAPVIGVIQVGAQAHADRYTYVPSIGLFFALIWGTANLLRRLGVAQVWLAVGSALLIAAAMFATSWQVSYWRNSTTLCERCLAVNSRNYVAHQNLGNIFFLQGKLAAAEAHYRELLKFQPPSAEAMSHLATVLEAESKFDEATTLFTRAVAADPNYAEAHFNWGLLLVRQGNFPAARRQFLTAIELQPGHARAEINLSLLLAAAGDTPAAIEHYEAAIRANPRLADSRVDQRAAWLRSLPLADAQRHLAQASRRTANDRHCQDLVRLVDRLYTAAQSVRPTTTEHAE